MESGMYNTGCHKKKKKKKNYLMIKSSLCDKSDAYILLKRAITLVGKGANAAAIAVDKEGAIKW